MPCRIGISTDPTTRKAYWETQVHGLKNWKIIGRAYSKDRAQQREDEYAATCKCESHHGGRDAEGTWYIYHFEYRRKR